MVELENGWSTPPVLVTPANSNTVALTLATQLKNPTIGAPPKFA